MDLTISIHRKAYGLNDFDAFFSHFLNVWTMPLFVVVFIVVVFIAYGSNKNKYYSDNSERF